MALFKNTKPTKNLSIPIADDAEATWQGADILQVANAGNWVEQEGELSLDVYVTDTNVVVRTVVAGVRPEDISVALHNDLLTIRGRRNEEHTETNRHYVLQECHWGAFSRSVVLPMPVQADSAEAIMKNGVLTIIIKRSEPTSVSVREIDAL
ncbi:MAG: Hsp20/alpha crystallin family protein [Patescibacteria group bacterium]|jgi:HSP20 family protein